jgi:type IV secretion system protein VirB11
VNDAATLTAGEGIYLRSCLEPFHEALSRPDVTDIYVNRPGELWIETLGGSIRKQECAALSELTLDRLARQLAALTHQGVSREHPLLSAILPDGSRIQVIAPPATRDALALAIRRQTAPSLTLADYAAGNQFEGTRTAPEQPRHDAEIAALIERHRFADALALAVRTRKNILVSGGTSTGKTTFLNALLREVPADERLILIEDTPELVCERPNCVKLVSVRSALGEAQVSMNDLVSASLRMRPDRIILGELRGPEALAFLRAVNTGHPGSMTSIHADSPEGAIEQLALLALDGGTRLTRSDVHDYVRQSIGVIVHLGRGGGRRQVEAVITPAIGTAVSKRPLP